MKRILAILCLVAFVSVIVAGGAFNAHAFSLKKDNPPLSDMEVRPEFFPLTLPVLAFGAVVLAPFLMAAQLFKIELQPIGDYEPVVNH